MPRTAPPGAPTHIQFSDAGEVAADLWVFGYGSLIWNPGFDVVERCKARLHGAHRALCVYSWEHRGTREKPGLVLGLDQGGTCDGIAFRVAAENVIATHAYLTERELITQVYRESFRRVRLVDGRQVVALTYVVERDHVQYARGLDEAATLAFIRQGHGRSGACVDYVRNTAKALAEWGIRDRKLEELASDLDSPSRPR